MTTSHKRRDAGVVTESLFDQEQPVSTVELPTENQLVEVPANPLELFQSLATQGVDPEKLKGLLDLHERWEDRQSSKAYSLAMKACQDEIKQLHIKPDKLNTHTNSWYAQLERISKMIDPITNKHGFSLSYDTEEHVQPDKMWIVCDCRHDAGHMHRYRLPLALDQFGLKGGANKTPVQAAVSSVTTGRRCLKCMIFDVVIEGMDNDGNADRDMATEDDIALINEWIERADGNLDAILSWAGIENLSELPADKVEPAINSLKKRYAARGGKL